MWICLTTHKLFWIAYEIFTAYIFRNWLNSKSEKERRNEFYKCIYNEFSCYGNHSISGKFLGIYIICLLYFSWIWFFHCSFWYCNANYVQGQFVPWNNRRMCFIETDAVLGSVLRNMNRRRKEVTLLKKQSDLFFC